MASYTPKFACQVAIEKCELCRDEEANYFCMDCQENMCALCKTAHTRSKVSHNHNVISSSLSKSDKKPSKPIKCAAHQRENIQMYCTTCDKAACLKCIADIKHKNHSFEELEATLDKNKGDLLKHISEIRHQILEINKSLHNIDGNVKDYITVSDKTINDINKQRKQIKSNVDNIADNMVDQVQQRRKQDLQLFEKERKDLQRMLSEQNQYLESCEEKLKSMDNMYGIQHQIKQSTKPKLLLTHKNPPTFVRDDTLNFQHIFGKLLDYLGENKFTQKLCTEEKVQKKKQESVDRTDHTAVTTISTAVVSKIKSGVYSEYVYAVNDKEVWCNGHNDNDGDNLVLIDIHGYVKKKIKLDFRLYSIAATSAEEVLVTGIGCTKINKYLQNGKCVNIANTELYCTQGLCVTSQGDILVCLYNSKDDNKVVRMTTAGQIKQTIQKDKQRRSLFTDPQYVVENINGDVVVVDGYQTASILVTSSKGELIFRYPHSVQSCYTFDWCSGIACDNTGCILISDNKNHRIHQIDIDGRFIQFVLTQQHGIQWPRDLTIDNKGQLWLCNQDCNEVAVYKYRSS